MNKRQLLILWIIGILISIQLTTLKLTHNEDFNILVLPTLIIGALSWYSVKSQSIELTRRFVCRVAAFSIIYLILFIVTISMFDKSGHYYPSRRRTHRRRIDFIPD